MSFCAALHFHRVVSGSASSCPVFSVDHTVRPFSALSILYVRISLRYGYDFHVRRNLTRARWTTSTHTDKNSALGTVNKIRRHIDLS